MSIATYIKQIWKDYPDKTTKITAERLNHMEDGIYQNNQDNIALNTSLLQHSNFPSGVDFYPDEKDGVKGYNTDPQRGADTFTPFSSGAKIAEFTIKTVGTTPKQFDIGDINVNDIVLFAIAYTSSSSDWSSLNYSDVYIFENGVPKTISPRPAHVGKLTVINEHTLQYQELSSSDSFTRRVVIAYG